MLRLKGGHPDSIKFCIIEGNGIILIILYLWCLIVTVNVHCLYCEEDLCIWCVFIFSVMINPVMISRNVRVWSHMYCNLGLDMNVCVCTCTLLRECE